MADLPPYPDSDGDNGVGAEHGSPPRTPRWVKVFGIVALVLILLVAGLLLFGPDSFGPGGGHGPGRHGLSPPGISDLGG